MIKLQNNRSSTDGYMESKIRKNGGDNMKYKRNNVRKIFSERERKCF